MHQSSFPDEDVIKGELDDVICGRDEAPEAVEERHSRLGPKLNS